MLVYFVRHASAGERKADPAKDEKRPLDEDGISQCGFVGRALALMDTHVDTIISSPLKRATQTASLIANDLAFEGKLDIDPALRPEAGYSQFRDLLDRHHDKEAVMVVGHNPNLSQFLGRLLGVAGTRSGVELKKGAVARIEVDHHRGVLSWLITPKVVRVLYETTGSSSRPNTSRK